MPKNKSIDNDDMSRDSILNDIFSDYYDSHIEDVTFYRDEALDDNHVEKTLEKYNYNYRRLIRRVTIFLSDDKLKKALEDCGISEEEYNNPTPEIFERMRDYIFNHHKTNK